MRDLIEEILLEERTSDTVVTAGSASDALAVMQHQPVDVLITDWRMPGMDGLALIEAVQLVRPRTHAILVTSADRDEVNECSRNRSASFAFFTKPFSIEAFLAHVDQVLTKAPFSRRERRARVRLPIPTMKPALSLG
jgi:DNA-binding NtrC family response regulator